MTLSIIIVSYNTKDLTLQTIESAWNDCQSSEILKNKTEIFIVDNNSKDGTVAAIKKQFPLKNIKVITNKDNKGFASANNQAIKKSKGEYVILLNSDTIVQKGALPTMVETFERYPLDDTTSTLDSVNEVTDRLGILAPTLINPNGTLQPQGGDLPSLLTLFAHMSFLDDIPLIGRLFPSTQHTGKRMSERFHDQSQQLEPLKRGWVGGTAMMIRREVIDEIGTLDDNIFMYGEDVEYCLRAKKHHWDVAIDRHAKITHFGQASSTSANAIKGEFKSYRYIWTKHLPLWQVPLVKFILALGITLRVILYTLLMKPESRRVYQSLYAVI